MLMYFLSHVSSAYHLAFYSLASMYISYNGMPLLFICLGDSFVRFSCKLKYEVL